MHVYNDRYLLKGGGTLGAILSKLQFSLREYLSKVILVSLESEKIESFKNEDDKQSKSFCTRDQLEGDNLEKVSTKIWISALSDQGSYVNPIKLRGLLELHLYKVCFIK